MNLLAAILLAAAPAAALPLKIVSVGHELIFDAPGSPRVPYAMEFIRLRMRMINVSESAISARDLIVEGPALRATDFVIDRDRRYVVDGKVYSGDVQPQGVIELWAEGHFTSGGQKSVTLDSGSDTQSVAIEVLPDPGCYDSDGGAQAGTRGWTIGLTACTAQAECGTTTRMSDLCEGDRLREFFCRPQSGVSVMTVNDFDLPCPNGCRDGACLQGPLYDPGRPVLKVVFPEAGERFKPGQKIAVVWESKGVSKVSFTLHSTNIHQQSGDWLLGLGQLEDGNSTSLSRHVGTLQLPKRVAPASDWSLLITRADGPEGIVEDTSQPFTIEEFPGQASGTPPKPDGRASRAPVEEQARVLAEVRARASRVDPGAWWVLAAAGALGVVLLWRFGARAARGVQLRRQARRLDLGYERGGQRLWSDELGRLPCLAAGRGRPIEHLLTHSISGSWKHAFDHAGQTIVLFPLQAPAKASRRSEGRWRLESDGFWLAAFRPGTLARPDQLAAFLDEAQALVKKRNG